MKSLKSLLSLPSPKELGWTDSDTLALRDFPHNPDGTISFPSNISCQTQNQDGCTARDSNCNFSNGGVSCSESFETTFTQDGSSAKGLLTLSCVNGNQTCVSTYSTSMVRE